MLFAQPVKLTSSITSRYGDWMNTHRIGLRLLMLLNKIVQTIRIGLKELIIEQGWLKIIPEKSVTLA
jgi:hypothetical protein